jgi:hypothetical protein
MLQYYSSRIIWKELSQLEKTLEAKKIRFSDAGAIAEISFA